MDVHGSVVPESEKSSVWLVYFLHIAGFFTGGLTSLAAIIINHIKRSDLQSPIAVSHFRWQMRTFWWGLLWILVSLALTYFLVGLVGFVLVFFWLIYRIVVGMVKFKDNKGMYGAV